MRSATADSIISQNTSKKDRSLEPFRKIHLVMALLV